MKNWILQRKRPACCSHNLKSGRRETETKHNIFLLVQNMSPKTITQKAPVKPRTAFICFKDSKLHLLTWTQDPNEILKYISKEWQKLDKKERAYWDEVSREDKVRYGRESEAYKGPVHAPKRRAKKDPSAPRRPMSAFLKFSQDCRKKIRKENPHLENTDISQLLGAIWKSAPDSEKSSYVEREKIERADYNDRMRKYKAKKAKEDAGNRLSHQEVQAAAEVAAPEPPRATYEPYRCQDTNIFRSYNSVHPADNKGNYRQAYAQPVYAQHKVAPESMFYPEVHQYQHHQRPPSPPHNVGYPLMMPENYPLKPTPSDLSNSDILLGGDDAASTSPYFPEPLPAHRQRPEASSHFGMGMDEYYHS